MVRKERKSRRTKNIVQRGSGREEESHFIIIFLVQHYCNYDDDTVEGEDDNSVEMKKITANVPYNFSVLQQLLLFCKMRN